MKHLLIFIACMAGIWYQPLQSMEQSAQANLEKPEIVYTFYGVDYYGDSQHFTENIGSVFSSNTGITPPGTPILQHDEKSGKEARELSKAPGAKGQVMGEQCYKDSIHNTHIGGATPSTTTPPGTPADPSIGMLIAALHRRSKSAPSSTTAPSVEIGVATTAHLEEKGHKKTE